MFHFLSLTREKKKRTTSVKMTTEEVREDNKLGFRIQASRDGLRELVPPPPPHRKWM